MQPTLAKQMLHHSNIYVLHPATHAQLPAVPRLPQFTQRTPQGAALGAVLLRGRSGNQRGIDDRPLVHLDPVRSQVALDHLQHLRSQAVFFDQVAKPQDGRLVRRIVPAQVQAQKLLHGVRVVHQLFGLRVGEGVPDLEEVEFEHPQQRLGPPAGAFCFGIEGLDQSAELLPGHDLVHRLQKLVPSGGLATVVEPSHGEGALRGERHGRLLPWATGEIFMPVTGSMIASIPALVREIPALFFLFFLHGPGPPGTLNRGSAETTVSGVWAMGMITVQVWDVTGAKRHEVELPDDVPVNRILAVLLEKMSLPQTAPDGQPLSYKFVHKQSGKQLLDEQTLADAGVQDGDVLRLNPEITAGA